MQNVTTLAHNKAIFRRFYEDAWNSGDLALVDELLADDFVNRELPASMASQSHRALYKQAIIETRAAFPDWRNTLEDMMAEGDRVAARWRSTGTRTGAAMQEIPYGKLLAISGITIVRVVDGKIAEFWKKDRHLT
ncbi:MAG TPA: ester cyclase [Ktedonobacterales bacterium]|nr:ester cyclase [Ktedonobacterales bacterium]